MVKDGFCSIEDIKQSINMDEEHIEKSVEYMVKQGMIETRDIVINGEIKTFYRMRQIIERVEDDGETGII